MKTNLLLLVAVLGFLSCSGDDDSSYKSNAELILGEWKYYGYKFDGNGSIPPQEEYADNACGFWATDTFTENNIVIYQDYDNQCEITGSAEASQYSVEGNYIIYHTPDDPDYSSHRIVVLNSNELVITNNGETSIYKR